MRLDRILNESGCAFDSRDGAIEVSSVCCDSRKVSYGSLFVAIKGFASDGHDYIATAIGKGARVIVYEDQAAFDSRTAALDMEGVVAVRTASSRHALAIIAANFHDNPSHKLTLVGITGTNGKTTTVTLLHRMFTAM